MLNETSKLSAQSLIYLPIFKKCSLCFKLEFFNTLFTNEIGITSFILPSPEASIPTIFPSSSTTAAPLFPGKLLAVV